MDKGLLCRGGGLFFVFEGGDGVGTTTQCQRLRRELESRGHDVLLTREPGGTLISERIRSLVLDKDLKYMSDLTELFLYAAARAQHVQETIVPALAKNQIVILKSP